MLRNVLTMLTIATGVLVASTGEVRAQPPAAVPSYSPYLNLARPGNLGVNYYGLVRPQIAVRNEIQQLQQTTTSLQSGISQLSSGDLITGHPAGFMYYGRYYAGIYQGGRTNRGGVNVVNTTANRTASTSFTPYRR